MLAEKIDRTKEQRENFTAAHWELIERERRNGRELHDFFFKFIELYVDNKQDHALFVKWINL